MDEKAYQAAPRRRFSRKLITILAVVFGLIIVGLAVGLGVGLTRRNNNSGATSTPTSTMSPVPSAYVRPKMWQPTAGDSWQIVLLAPITIGTGSLLSPNSVNTWDIDMFTNSKDAINSLHIRDKNVICYFSAGSYEPYRPDSKDFSRDDLGLELDGWPGEKWLNTNSASVRSIMAKRIELAAYKGCDAIDPDNIDGYANKNGLNLKKADAIDYMTFLSAEAARYNMSTGLKNSAAIIPDVLNITAFQVNEQCSQYNECKKFQPYIAANKPVYQIEYPKGATTNNDDKLDSFTLDLYCNNTGMEKFSTLMKNMNLDGWVQTCNGNRAITQLDSSVVAKGDHSGTSGKASIGAADALLSESEDLDEAVADEVSSESFDEEDDDNSD